jgi:hypothetical protein
MTADLLRQAIETGISLFSWKLDSFAHSERYDEENMRYKGLRAGFSMMITLDSSGLLVKPEIADKQLTEEKKARESQQTEDHKGDTPGYTPPESVKKDSAKDLPEEPAKKTRFFGNTEADATRFIRVTDDIEKEILKHLIHFRGTSIKINIHIEATNQNGFNEVIERTIRENGRTLGFGTVEFE